MCGIFGLFASSESDKLQISLKKIVDQLFFLSESRGKEAAGIAIKTNASITILKEPLPASSLIKTEKYNNFFEKTLIDRKKEDKSSLSIICHSRLVTNGLSELNSNNQPVIKDGAVGVHNGIIVNDNEIWSKFPEIKKLYDVDTEVFLGLLQLLRKEGNSIFQATRKTFKNIQGSASVAILFNDSDYGFLGSNTGSLFFTVSQDKSVLIFASEKQIIKELVITPDLKIFFEESSIIQVKAGLGYIVDLKTLNLHEFSLETDLTSEYYFNEKRLEPINIINLSSDDKHLPPSKNLITEASRQSMIKTWDNIYSGKAQLKRCTRCLLPETLPFITFDEQGVCNHCRSFDFRGSPIKGEKELKKFVANFKSDTGEPDCLLGFSGGRDSSYGLFYIKKVLNLNPITFIYDWGMVTDLARRNQARVCGNLGIEQIIISADIKKKREYIHKNLTAWLKKPDLGMVPLLMAGDKEFYHYFHKIRKENNIKLFIFCGGYEGEESTGIFKLGFCGVNRDSGNAEFRMTGISIINKLKLISYYLKNFLINPAYINRSFFDTLFAFYSSYVLPDDYVYLFNYIQWNEDKILTTIREEFNWEQETDTIATWRTDDGTAALYNYIYLTMAGFTEFDLIRSHQIRDGQLTRESALKLVREENKPRFQSLEWYAQVIGIDVNKIINTINDAPKLYKITSGFEET